MQAGMHRNRLLKQCAAVLSTISMMSPAWAEIHVGQIAPMTGPISVEGKGANIGIRVAIDAANAQGGVAGQKLVLRTEDDEYRPEKTKALIQQLAKTDTLALMVPVGSPSMTKILQDKVLEATGMPVIGVVPGAEPLRKPLNPYLYHVRAGDMDQYRSLVRNALTIGLNRVAVVYADIPFGKAGVAAVESLLAEASLKPVANIPISVKADADHGTAMDAIRKANPNIVVLVSPGQIAGDFLRAYRAQGMAIQVTTLSYGDPQTLCQVATPDAVRGVSVAQVFPNIANTTRPVVRQFQEDFRLYGPKDAKPSVQNFEGYMSARVLIEAIRRINGAPTREKLVKSLDSMQKVDLGGFLIDFSPVKHTGSEFVDIGVISKDCKLLF